MYHKPKNVINEYCLYNPAFLPTDDFGFINTGAICWCNSLIQMLLSMPSLSKILLENKESLASNVFTTEYIKLLQSANDKSQIRPNPLILTENLANASIRILGALQSQMIKNGDMLNITSGQECVDEALTAFINSFGCAKVENLFTNVYELSIRCDGCKKITSSCRDKSFRIEMFINNMSITTEQQFQDWLTVHHSNCAYYKCECGYVMTNFNRIEQAKILREIIVIVFDKYQVKDYRWFPQTITFPSVGGTKLQYKLVAKIEHSGNMNGGHYWTNVLRNSCWKQINDTIVTQGDKTPNMSTVMIAYHMDELIPCL